MTPSPLPAAAPTSTPVVASVARVLAGHRGGLSVRDLMRALRADRATARVPRSAVEAALAADPRFLERSAAGRTTWTVDPARAPAVPDGLALAVTPDRPLDGLELRDWQVDAFAAWAANGFRGVIEAVTGTGKTRLAIAATRAALAHDGRVLVLVPTLELADQWVRELRRFVPQARIGRLGGGHADDLHDHHVVVSTPHSAAPVPIDVPAAGPGLLVADEAHRYGAPTWADALKPSFAMRLALTATYERSDDGLEDVLGPYFGGVAHRYGYDQAVPDGVVAPFRIAFVGTGLDPDERQRYDRADARVRELHGHLIDRFGFARDPRRLIQAAARAAAEADARGGRSDGRAATARAYLSVLRQRRDVAASCAGKLDIVRAVAPGVRAHADRTLVFTDTVDQAELAVQVLAAAGVHAEELHGDLARDKRRIRLAQFRNGNLDVLVAPRVLDEGIDVPAADVAVVLASFRTRRQMIQRLGRVLRLKPDGREARLVVGYATDTREDPEQGGHDDFLGQVLSVADEVTRLDLDDQRQRDTLAGWLAPRRAPTDRPPRSGHRQGDAGCHG